MSTEQWEKVKEIVSDALTLPEQERSAFIRGTAAGDVEILAEVESLLEWQDGVASGVPNDVRCLPCEPAAAFGPGFVIDGRYRIDRLLGSGGFAEAWLASDLTLHGRPVVLKVLQRNEDAWFEEAFARELGALAQIDHPGVVQPLGTGRLTNGRPFIVMQYVVGRTLRDLVSGGPMPFTRVAELARKIGAAVDAAHSRGIYHSDLKPENILVQTLPGGGEEPRLIDFGIARIRKSPAELESTVHIAGTLRYMAPEQLAGRIGKTTDIYAVAVISFEMLTGQVPYPATELPILVRQHQEGPPIPSRLRAGIPAEADRLILQALANDPSLRPASALGFTDRLAAALMPPQPAQARKRRSKAGWLLAGAFAVIAAVAIYLNLHPQPAAVPNAVQGRPNAPAPVFRDRKATFQISTKGRSRQPEVENGIYRLDGSFRIAFRPLDSGHLYLLSEEAEKPEGMSILFPSPSANDGSSHIDSGALMIAPANSWFGLDLNKRQRLWLVWSASPVGELEDAKRWINDEFRGAIRSDLSRSKIRVLLAQMPKGSISLDTGEIQPGSDSSPIALSIEMVHR